MVDISKLEYKTTESLSKKIRDLYMEVIPPGEYVGKVCKVCDGDTVWLIVDSSLGPIKIKIRLNTIDAPETRGCSEEEKRRGLISKEFVHKLIYGEIVTCVITGLGSFDRYLGNIYPSKEIWMKHLDENEYDDLYYELGGKDGKIDLGQYSLYVGLSVLYKKK